MEYYIVKTGSNSYDMRQTRFKAQRAAGNDHPHDLMAVGFTADGMRDTIAKYFDAAEIDMTALPESK